MKLLRFYFDRAVETYEKAGKIQRLVAEELFQKIKRQHYSTVVEIGSGKGFLSIPFMESFSFERFIHIDISLEFLKRLKGLKNKTFLINARAEAIPLKDNSADLVISSSTLHWIENQEQNLIKIFRILKEGGRFYFSIFTSNTLKELKEVSLISGFGSVYPLQKPEFYIDMIENTGFSFEYELKSYKIVFDSPKELLLSHKLTGTNYTENKKFSGKESFRDFCEIYKKYFGNYSGIYATYEVLFIEGQKLSVCLQC